MKEKTARIRPFNNLIPLKQIEQVDGDLWRGKLIKTPSMKEEAFEGDFIFFWRNYDPANNDIDKYCQEYEIKGSNKTLPQTFILVPKEKCLFLWEAPSTIIRPEVNTRPKRRFQ